MLARERSAESNRPFRHLALVALLALFPATKQKARTDGLHRCALQDQRKLLTCDSLMRFTKRDDGARIHQRSTVPRPPVPNLPAQASPWSYSGRGFLSRSGFHHLDSFRRDLHTVHSWRCRRDSERLHLFEDPVVVDMSKMKNLTFVAVVRPPKNPNVLIVELADTSIGMTSPSVLP